MGAPSLQSNNAPLIRELGLAPLAGFWGDAFFLSNTQEVRPDCVYVCTHLCNLRPHLTQTLSSLTVGH